MAISRSLMNRQLQADGGIMQVAPREKFCLGSKLKKFVRKIIPNEVAEIATKAAPFVAPFNPAVAAAMSGLGTFDQTGSIGQSLKGAGMNYAGGQAARYIGGAGFQDPSLSAFTPSGFKSGFSSPLGSETGLGKFFSNQGTEGVQAIDSSKPLKKPLNIQAGDGAIDLTTGGADGFGIIQDTVVDKSIVTQNDPGFLKNLFDGVSNQDYGKVARTIGDGAKKFGKAMFTNKDGSIDKAAVMGAITFATSYAEALALANDAGIELTEEDYNQAQADEKKAEYAGYLTNFFGGKKDGGRIGFESGANEMIKTQLLEEIMPNTDTTTEDYIVIMTEDGPKVVLRSQAPSESMMMDTTTSVFGGAGRGRRLPEEFRADGGRIGFKRGSPEETSEIGIMSIDVEAGNDDDEEDMMMAAGINFSRQEKSYLFRRLGGAGGSDRSYTMPNLYRILNNPGRYPEDAAVLKEIAIMGMKKDGGRIGFKDGTDESLIEKLLNSKIAQEGRYGASEFFFGDPIMFGTPDKFKDGKNDNRGTFKRNPSDYDKLSPEKQAYIEAFLNSDEGQLFLKPGKIKFPTNKKMREHNKKITLEDFNEDRNPLELLLGIDYENRAKGGRIGYKGGANRVSELLILRDELIGKGEDVSDIEAEIFQLTGKTFRSVGGISDVPTGKMRKNNAGVVERDYRDEGGFVPVGIKERADDVPAMLSKNEFVMTADAVRGIGNGSVEEGSKKLYNTMKKAEQVGKA